jgi:hypothetical protein
MSGRCNQTGSPRRSRPHKFHCGNGGALRLPSPTGSTSYWSNQLQARDAKRRSDPGKRTIVTSITVKRLHGKFSLRRHSHLFSGDSSVAWSTQTFVPGTSAVMQADGNFVLYTPSGQPVWHTQTSGNPGAFFNVQDDGNLVVYSSTGHRCGTRGQTSCQEETPNTLATLWEEI